MSLDLFSILKDWPYEPGHIKARIIEGDDGEPKIQVRLDLGVLQMAMEGRPDGQRPNGYGSYLEYYESKLDRSEFEGGEAGAEVAEGFSLGPEDCRLLREEAAQYYHRYVALMVLEEYEGVVRDTTRNLRVMELCAAHAETEGDRTGLEQFRAYVTMMRARAMASLAIKQNEPRAAVHALDEGLTALRQHFADRGQAQMFEHSSEAEMLKGMRDALVPKLPVSQGSELRRRLQRALEQENYELAAILRDEIKNLKDAGPKST